jgi:hypothetical protein
MMDRRTLLASMGVVGTAGCLRLQGGGTNSAATDGDGAGATQTATDTPDDALGDAERLSLSEKWAADFGVDFVETDDGHFHFNDYNRVGEAISGDGIIWTDEVGDDDASNLGADAIAVGDDVTVFGFFSEPASVDDPGATVFAYDNTTGEEAWRFFVPAAEGNDYTNLPRGAVVSDGTAVVAINAVTQQSAAVYGIDVARGDERWASEEYDYINDLAAADGSVYLNTNSGVFVLDPASGSVVEQHEAWRGSRCRIHGRSFFVVASADSRLHAYPLADGAVEWTGGDVEIEADTALVVDNSLVVAGTEPGGIHAFERATGERRWEASIGGTVWQMALSPDHVWVADRETGLTAYDRDDGSNVHRSSQPLGRADIAVASRTIVLGNDTLRAYDIETE